MGFIGWSDAPTMHVGAPKASAASAVPPVLEDGALRLLPQLTGAAFGCGTRWPALGRQPDCKVVFRRSRLFREDETWDEDAWRGSFLRKPPHLIVLASGQLLCALDDLREGKFSEWLPIADYVRRYRVTAAQLRELLDEIRIAEHR